VLLLDTFAQRGTVESVEPEEAQFDLLHIWTFAKFSERLQLMHDIRGAKASNPDQFVVDELGDPWSEFGPSEIASIRQAHRERLETSHDEIEKLRSSIEELVNQTPSVQSWAGSASKSIDMQRLEDVTSWELENARLREQVRVLETSLQLANSRAVASAPRYDSEAPVSGTSTHRGKREASTSVEDMRLRPENATSLHDQASAPTRGTLLSILDVSKANLLLVLDLFNTLSRLSTAMLHASAACLAAKTDMDPMLPAARNRLAEAAEELAAFFMVKPGAHVSCRPNGISYGMEAHMPGTTVSQAGCGVTTQQTYSGLGRLCPTVHPALPPGQCWNRAET